MFIYNLEDVAKKLKIDFDGITKRINHNGVKGSSREDILKEYLRLLLPDKYSISSGIVMDSYQTQSKQQDFIIHDSFNCPSFYKVGSNSILPIESVFAIIEIKSSLNYNTLNQCAKNIESVRKLQKQSNKNSLKITNELSDQYPLGFVFAYSSDNSLEQIQVKLHELNKEIDGRYQISIICILDKGLIFNVEKGNITTYTVIPTNDTILARSDSDIDNSLYSFYLLLLQYLNSVIIQEPNLIEYAKKSNSFKVPLSIPNELIPDDAVYNHQNIKINYKDIRTINNVRNKNNNIFRDNMTYIEFKECLKTNAIEIIEIGLKSFISNDKKLIDIFGYKFDDRSFKQFKKYASEYDTNEESKNNFDYISSDIYKYYLKAFNDTNN